MSPQAVGLYELSLLVKVGALSACSAPAAAVRRRQLCSGLAAFLALRLEYVRADVPYLGASSAANFSLLKMIQANGRGLAISAIDHAHPAVMEGRPLYRSSRSWVRYVRAIPGYDYPAPTTLRTRDGQWERTVLDLLELVPLVVLDAQILAPHVVQELDWITSGEYAYKTILVTDPASPLRSADAGGFCAVATGAASCCASSRSSPRAR